MKIKKILKRCIIISCLIILLIYVLCIENIPESIILFENENLSINTIFGMNIQTIEENFDTIMASSNIQNEKIGNKKVAINLFGITKVKEIDIDIISDAEVSICGEIAGLKLYTSGVLIVGMSEIKDINNISSKPYEKSGLEEGDRIIKINNEEITCTSELVDNVNKSRGETLEIEYIRDEEIRNTSITPVKTGNDEYKVGLWVRDMSCGIGTVTFYEPSTKLFASLGHGIVDIDTEEIVEISSGEFTKTNILSIQKGEKANPRKNSRNN